MRQYDKTIMVDTSQMDLHQLARAYYDGQLNFDQYRYARKELLDRATGEVTIVVRHPIRPVENSPSVSSEERASLSRLNGRVLILLVIAILVMISVVFWLSKD